ncbi:LysR family transcriptional regulator [Pyruvatibacter mobilis]|uniref:LysR family transcriptional regulator n=1 Tax=Pyruvatibacter mobilis TaxID=1712261 RepID=UPI003D14672E
MDLHRLRIFLAAADELSFRRAAVLMGVGQPVVSRQVAALEDELGVTLFERRSTGACLTEAGRVFSADPRRIIADVDRAREVVTSVALGTAGRLRLAICEDATTPTLASILTAFREHCPKTDLDLFELPSAMQPAALRRGEVDVGLLLPPVQDQALQLDELWRDDWLVAMRSDHRLADLETVPLCALAGEDFITAHPQFGPGCHAQSEALFCAEGIKPRIVARAFRRLTMAILVRAGAGVTLVPGAFANTKMDGIVTRPLSAGEHGMCVAAAYPEGDLAGTVAQFLRVAHAAVEQHQ